jgi:MerR family transcriptional regulator/heat shock protein HspR
MRLGRHGYFISHVAEVLNCHPQTLRLYERLGLIRPSRSNGRQRRYTDEDLRTLRFIQFLTDHLGVNLAGVEVIMNMRDQILELREKLAQLEAEVCQRPGFGGFEDALEAEYWEIEDGTIMVEGTDVLWR